MRQGEYSPWHCAETADASLKLKAATGGLNSATEMAGAYLGVLVFVASVALLGGAHGTSRPCWRVPFSALRSAVLLAVRALRDS